ncbi:hypothetical protein ACH5RR_026072 [Cinchona calisaya]|uniref:Uncharacterized protein n=1 Tax=Cinchona calisaya TaxID=153742 RepID=A0ABD2Z4U7_9GENT
MYDVVVKHWRYSGEGYSRCPGCDKREEELSKLMNKLNIAKDGLTTRVKDLAGSLACMPFPSCDRLISIEDVPPNKARLTSSSEERSIWPRKQALGRLSPML